MTREHLVRVKLKSKVLWDIESRIKEVQTIRDWVFEQCDWNVDRFEIKLHSQGSIMDIWFENEKDATICVLRWGS